MHKARGITISVGDIWQHYIVCSLMSNKKAICVCRFLSNKLDSCQYSITYISVILYLMFHELVTIKIKYNRKCFSVENYTSDTCASPKRSQVNKLFNTTDHQINYLLQTIKLFIFGH